ncbi:MAG TPA: phosphoglycerate dehydrogenase [Acidobacteriota bacterium]|nr:phosphoglycerate dehydrogenase [Acidobacteriota bacterium]
MHNTKILISDNLSHGAADMLHEAGFGPVFCPDISRSELLERISDFDVLLVRSKTRVDAELLERATRLKVVGRAGAGVDNIDLDTATRRGVLVMNTPGGNSISAAEHTVALLLALARKVPQADLSMKQGQWDKKRFEGVELFGKALGLLGLGKIGSEVSKRARAMGMDVIAYDPYISEKFARDLEVKLVSMEEVLARSDFLSLHLPLVEETEHLVNDATIKKMKTGIRLLNCARGGLVDEQALLRGLNSGKIAAAALDVFEQEPSPNRELISHSNIIATPHIAGSTQEAKEKVGFEIVQQVMEYLRTGVVRNAVNFASISSREFEQIAPYLELGEKLGGFAGQVSRIRVNEVGIRYYGELTELNYKPISSCILKGVFQAMRIEGVNLINALSIAKERRIEITETSSNRERGFKNLISIQLRNERQMEWVEGALLHRGNVRLVSVDGIGLESPLGNFMLFIRNQDQPGVIGQVGTLLGSNGVNIASFTLGRHEERGEAIGVVNTDSPVSAELLKQIQALPAVGFASTVRLDQKCAYGALGAP